ncbi:YceD family protein [Rhodoferax sp.]|uniref:YceD family protein n=1 Tax=Rhodoferax sp. TaxID=50421 RepID=UPI00374CA394
MKTEIASTPLDVRAFAQSAGSRSAQELLQKYERLSQEASAPAADLTVNWQAQGELREVPGGVAEIWLHLQADTCLPLTCQRCLTPVQVDLAVDRSFRFVADEETAAAQDDEAEEDVLALDPEFDLALLVEDELLMEIPLVPRHEVCPVEVTLEVVDPAFEAALAEKPNPFAALAKLRTEGSD